MRQAPISTKHEHDSPGSFSSRVEAVLSQTSPVIVDGVKLVFKNYAREPGVLKWFLVKTANIMARAYPYTLDPATRMKREVEFFEHKACPVSRPRVFAKDWIKLVLVREFVEGKYADPRNPSDYRVVGETLAKLHNAGFALGDSKLYNFIITPSGSVYVIDGEQAIETWNEGYMYWDLLVFVITATYALIEVNAWKALQVAENTYRELLESYLASGGVFAERVLMEREKINYKILAHMLLPIPYNVVYSKIVASIAGKSLSRACVHSSM